MALAKPYEPYLIRDGLAVYRIGQGEPVLMMPGPHRFERPGLRAADALIGALTGAGGQVITFDPPGSGHSRRPARLGMAEMHQCADRALDGCGASGPVDAAGHSMAGLVLLAYALDHPHRLRRLVLIGTGSGGPAYMAAPGALWNRTHPGFRGLAVPGLLHMAWPRRATETMLNNYITRRSFADPRLASATRVLPGDWLRHRRGNWEWHRIARKMDYSPRLGEISIPTLVLCGRRDPEYPPACSEQLATGFPVPGWCFSATAATTPTSKNPPHSSRPCGPSGADQGAGSANGAVPGCSRPVPPGPSRTPTRHPRQLPAPATASPARRPCPERGNLDRLGPGR